MGEVVNLREPDLTFVVCNCSEDGNLFAPIAKKEEGRIVVVGLVCPECDTLLMVYDGFIEMA